MDTDTACIAVQARSLRQRRLLQKVQQRGQIQHASGGAQGGLAGDLGLRKICGHRSHIRSGKAIFLLAQIQLGFLPESHERSHRSSQHPWLVPVRDAPPAALRRFRFVSVFSFCTHTAIPSNARISVQAAFQPKSPLPLSVPSLLFYVSAAIQKHLSSFLQFPSLNPDFGKFDSPFCSRCANFSFSTRQLGFISAQFPCVFLIRKVLPHPLRALPSSSNEKAPELFVPGPHILQIARLLAVSLHRGIVFQQLRHRLFQASAPVFRLGLFLDCFGNKASPYQLPFCAIINIQIQLPVVKR